MSLFSQSATRAVTGCMFFLANFTLDGAGGVMAKEAEEEHVEAAVGEAGLEWFPPPPLGDQELAL